MSTPSDQSDDEYVPDETWRYGFRWGPMKVQRLAHVDGRGYCLEVSTEYDRLQIYVSEKGRKIEPVEILRDDR